VYHDAAFASENEVVGRTRRLIMLAGRLAVAVLFCVGLLQTTGSAAAQDVKSTYDKSADFTKLHKYTWGPNYLLTHQTKDVQDEINMAIVDSINRNLKAGGFVEDDKNPDFVITYEAGGHHDVDMGAQRFLYASDMTGYYWGGNISGITSDAWATTMTKIQITATDAATKNQLWQATASKRINDRKKFAAKLQENVDNYIRKTMKSFPPKK
jgi:Domain of unknown function (DUF4136)